MSCAFEVVELVAAYLAGSGLAAPDDLVVAFREAVDAAAKRRETAGLEAVPTFLTVQQQIAELTGRGRPAGGPAVLARQRGRCVVCGDAIVAGDVAVLVEGEWAHETCSGYSHEGGSS